MERRFHEDVDPLSWQQYYSAAIYEQDEDLRPQRIEQAQAAILQRAREMEECEAPDTECQVLEDAARVLGRLKRATRFRFLQ